jgi:hypothetical protein
MKVRMWLPLAIMLGLAARRTLANTYISNGEQDECTFGPISNEQYHAYPRLRHFAML